MQMPERRWIILAEFKKLEGKTDRQVEYMRGKPLWFKLNASKGRWLIDTKEYYRQYNKGESMFTPKQTIRYNLKSIYFIYGITFAWAICLRPYIAYPYRF